MSRESTLDHSPHDDETRPVESACFACDGTPGAESLCRDCLATRAIEAEKTEQLVREVEDYARALHLMRWSPDRASGVVATLERELSASMARLRALLGGRL